MSDQAFCRSTGRSTVAKVGQPSGRSMCTKHAQSIWLEGWSTGRSTAKAPVDRPVNRPESCALGSGLVQLGGRPVVQSSGTVDEAVDRQAVTVKNMTVGWSTGRSTDTRVFCRVSFQRIDFDPL